MKCKTLQMLQERLKERLWDLFAPDPYYSTLCISVQSFISALHTHRPTSTLSCCVFFFFFIFPPIKFSLSVLCCFSLLSVTILLSLFISSAKLCYARCLNAPSLCSECCVSRAELKARECSTQSQAHSSVSKEPSTLLHY